MLNVPTAFPFSILSTVRNLVGCGSFSSIPTAPSDSRASFYSNNMVSMVSSKLTGCIIRLTSVLKGSSWSLNSTYLVQMSTQTSQERSYYKAFIKSAQSDLSMQVISISSGTSPRQTASSKLHSSEKQSSSNSHSEPGQKAPNSSLSHYAGHQASSLISKYRSMNYTVQSLYLPRIEAVGSKQRKQSSSILTVSYRSGYSSRYNSFVSSPQRSKLSGTRSVSFLLTSVMASAFHSPYRAGISLKKLTEVRTNQI